MNQERRKVLEMTQQGVITITEAEDLLNVLGWEENTAVSPSRSTLHITSSDWPGFQRAIQIVASLFERK